MKTCFLIIEHIMKEVKDDWNMYKMEKWYTLVCQKWLNCPHTLTLQEESLLDCGWKGPPRLIPKPSHLLIINVAQEKSLYLNGQSNMLNYVIIKHQHIPLCPC